MRETKCFFPAGEDASSERERAKSKVLKTIYDFYYAGYLDLLRFRSYGSEINAYEKRARKLGATQAEIDLRKQEAANAARS